MKSSHPSGRDVAEPVPTEIDPTLLPPPSATLTVQTADGLPLVVRRHGNPAGPRLMMSHGNGMAIDMYFPYWRTFLEDCDVVVYDLRNHGWNPTGDIRRHQLASFIWDNERVWAAVREAWGAKPTAGIYHSMSALTAIHQSLRVGPRWDALLLFEPPISPPLGHRLEPLFLDRISGIARVAAERKSHFESYEAFASVLARTRQFEQLVPESLPLFAAATLRPDADGGYCLRCPREFEAQIFNYNIDSSIELGIRGFPVPLKIIGGDPERAGALTPTIICHELFPQWEVEFEVIPNSTHFMQLEFPEQCATATRAFLREHMSIAAR